MSFLADTIIFDGHSCSEFGLMLGYIGQGGDDSSQFASGPDIIDKQINRQWRPYFYGVTRQKKLSFQVQLVMAPCITVDGVVTERENGAFLERKDIEAVARWLTSPNSYRWLEIIQEDMYPKYKYRCMVTDLTLDHIGDKPCGFTATFTCDSPYAYLRGITISTQALSPGQSKTIIIYNDSTMEALYYPVTTISFTDAPGGVRMENQMTGQIMTLDGIPSTVREVYIDNERRIIRSDQDVNLYACSNFAFIGLARGRNLVDVTNTSENSDAVVNFSCSFPVDIGC